MSNRNYRWTDRVLMDLQQALRTLHADPHEAIGPHPDDEITESLLSADERRESARLMRVNHAGEISAQALYQGQSLFSRDPAVRDTLRQAAREEHAHLIWCQRRLEELEDRPSRLAPLWYLGSFGIGTLAGLVGDRWSLGFVVETENQVIDHIQNHLDRLPAADAKSRAILDQMERDEVHHGDTARRAGARNLPGPVRRLMHAVSRIMTRGAYFF